MTVFDINGFDPNKNYVIKASAGTGKTYNIVEIVKRLAGCGVDPEKILFVTYTEKAAGELRDRIRSKVPSVNIEKISVGTIHSFCRNIIDEFSVSSGKPSGLRLIGQAEERDFVRAYIRQGEVYKRICYIKHDHPRSVIEDDLIRRFVAVLENYYLDFSYSEDADIVSFDLDRKLARVIAGGEDPDTVFPELLVFKDSKNKKANDFYEALTEKFNEDKIFRFDKRKFKESHFAEGEEKEAFLKMQEICACFTQTIPKNETPEQRENREVDTLIKSIVVYYADDIYGKYLEFKASGNEQTYSDMLRNVREEVVRGGALLQRIREKYSYAIIDEFQDTNQLQWDIFKRTFLDDPDHHIIVVGDEKQSIYSFQGADLNVYGKAVNEIIGNNGVECSLNTNYRASPGIVENTNRFFDNDNANPSVTESGFPESLCGNNEYGAFLNGNPTEAYWIHENSTSDTYADAVCRAIIECCRRDASGHTALQVTDDKGVKRDVSFGDFAILARTRSEMEPVEKALKDCGIPHLRYKDNALFKGKECAGWIALLAAIDAPDFTGNNRVLFKRAQYSLFFGRTLDEIELPFFDKDNTPEIILFDKWRSLAGQSRWDELIDSVINDSGMSRRMSSLNDLKTYGVMKQLGDYCEDHLSDGGSLASLVRHLKKRLEDSDDEASSENEDLIARGTDFDCVQIMTIHASKGLEFPVVISVAGFKGPNNKVDIRGYHNEDGKYILTLYTHPSVRNENIAEWKRLIYVAYTRAKYVLILPHYAPINADYGFISASVDEYMKGKKYIPLPEMSPYTYEELKDAVGEILNKSGLPASGNDAAEKARQEELLKKIIRGEYRRSAYKYTYSSLSHPHTETESVDDRGVVRNNGEEESPENDLSVFDRSAKQVICGYDGGLLPTELSPDYPMGAGLGNALHRVMELADYTGTAQDRLYALIGTSFENEGFRVRDEWICDSIILTDNVLQARLPVIRGGHEMKDESFSLNSIAAGDRINEAEFNFNKDNEYLHRYFNGFIDLVFRRGEYYSILDWKSDRLNEDFTSYSDAGILKAHTDSLYSIQRVLYSYCLIKWLKGFYPALGEAEIYERHFGGVYYVFLRGCNAGTGNGIYAQTWNSFDDLKKEYDNIVFNKLK